MNQVNCESIRLAAMAVADGENPPIPAPEIELHLSTCDHCRSDVAQLNALLKLLDGQRRRERTENVWDGIAADLRPKTAPPNDDRSLALVDAPGFARRRLSGRGFHFKLGTELVVETRAHLAGHRCIRSSSGKSV